MPNLRPVPRWNQGTILGEILKRHQTQQDLSYSGMLRENLALLRASVRYFGSWQGAIEAAGLDYDDLRRYKHWTNDRILLTIREYALHGADLSWRHVSTTLDPSLAAAAVKTHHFGSWQKALIAAGLDYRSIRRYRDWSNEEVLHRIRERFSNGLPLNAKALERDDMALITAARRRFLAWHKSLEAAGLDFREFVVRQPSEKQ